MKERAKVVFELDEKESPFASESVWAERLFSNTFRILNSPFFAFGVSYEDEVEAEPDGEVFRFTQVVRRSGRSTYRLIFQGDQTAKHDDFARRWVAFREAGCTYEVANQKYIAMDMPPVANVGALYSLLEDGERDGVWVFEEGYYAGSRN